MFSAYFYTIDLVVGFTLPVYLHLRHRWGANPPGVIGLFWLGVAIGLTWEIPIFLSAILASDPIVTFVREPPLPALVFLVAHALWDGGLFLAGLALVETVCGKPILERFRWKELLALVVWGQVSELAVEMVSVANDAWVYAAGHAWNPVLFHFAGHPITLIPQLIWLAAPVAYYLCALRLVRGRIGAPRGFHEERRRSPKGAGR